MTALDDALADIGAKCAEPMVALIEMKADQYAARPDAIRANFPGVAHLSFDELQARLRALIARTTLLHALAETKAALIATNRPGFRERWQGEQRSAA